MYIVLLLFIFSPVLMAMEKTPKRLKSDSYLSSINHACWHPKNSQLMVATEYALALYKISQNKIEWEHSLEINRRQLLSHRFSPQGNYYWGLETARYPENNLHIWSTISGKLLKTYKTVLFDIPGISPKDTYVVYQPNKDSLEVHQISAEEEVLALKDSSDAYFVKNKFSTIFSPDDSLVACEIRKKNNQVVSIINLKNKKEIAALEGNSPLFNTEGTQLIIKNGITLSFFETKNFTALKKISHECLSAGLSSFLFNPDFSRIQIKDDKGIGELIFPAGRKNEKSGRHLASTKNLDLCIMLEDSMCWKCSAQSGADIKSLVTLREWSPKSTYFSPDEKYLILEDEKDIDIVNPKTIILLKSIRKPESNSRTSSCSSDSKYLLWHPTFSSAEILDLETLIHF